MKAVARCPVCKLGWMGRVQEHRMAVEVAPGESYDVVLCSGVTICDRCCEVRLAKEAQRFLKVEADRQQRARVMERDGYCCARCGRSDRPLHKAHKVGKSRARNPGPTRNAIENQEACCDICHGQEHGW